MGLDKPAKWIKYLGFLIFKYFIIELIQVVKKEYLLKNIIHIKINKLEELIMLKKQKREQLRKLPQIK